MTQEESIDLIEWIEEGQHRATSKALKRYSLGALLGFLILFVGLVVVRHEDANRAKEATAARIAVADSQRKAIVQSGTVVAVGGCNERFKDRQEVRAVLEASKAESLKAYNAGDITKERLRRSLAFYDQRLDGLPLPDCRQSQNILTTDINAVPPVPKPLYPGSPDAQPKRTE